MCKSYTDYWDCGHTRRTRIVRCDRRYCYHLVDKGKGTTYFGDCGHKSCQQQRHRSSSYVDDTPARVYYYRREYSRYRVLR